MARRRPATTHGLCIVDKPSGVTSHDVVGMLRRRFDERQVGHGGTLDPDATGVLVVAVGMATKLLRFVESTTKRYVGEVVLGTETATLDAAGDVTATHDMSGVTVEQARAVVASHLVGEIEQIPPMVSAIKIQGKRLHELARQGIEVDRPPRPVTIHAFEVIGQPEPGVLAIDVVCSPGTYVRTLAADLGHLLGRGRRCPFDPERVPRPRGFDAACRRLGLDPLELALGGGDDYELLFAVAPGAPSAAALSRRLGVRVSELGRVSRGAAPHGPGGWGHFARTES